MQKTNTNKKLDFVLDGTNICNWSDISATRESYQSKNFQKSFSLQNLLQLILILLERENSFQCIFDANTIYSLPTKEKNIYRNLLKKHKNHFYQVTGGIKADGFIIMSASKSNAAIISNDVFSEYIKTYPWLNRNYKPQRLFKGGTPWTGDMPHLMIPDLAISKTLNTPSNKLYELLVQQLEKSQKRVSGKIKTFNSKTGWGFIASQEFDIYFNKKDLLLDEGLEVEFLPQKQHNKAYASAIKIKPLQKNKKSEKEKTVEKENQVLKILLAEHETIVAELEKNHQSKIQDLENEIDKLKNFLRDKRDQIRAINGSNTKDLEFLEKQYFSKK